MMAALDPFQAVIKGAIVVESEMEEVFRLTFLDATALYDMKLTYDQKVNLLIALGIDPRLATPLKTLARIRNKFAHTIDAKLTEVEAKNFYASFHSTDRSIINDTFAALYRQKKNGKSAKISDLEPLDQVVLCITTLRAAILAAQKQTTYLLQNAT